MVSTANGEPVQTRGLVPGILHSILATLAFFNSTDAAEMVQGQQMMATAGNTDLFRAHPF